MRPIPSALLLLLALIVYGAGGLVGLRTQAAYTDTATSLSNTFATGTVDIALSSASDCDTPAAPSGYSDAVGAVMTSTGRVPGDVATGSICINNGGTLTTRWSLSSAVTDNTGSGSALKGVSKIRFWSLSAAGAAAGTACVSGFNSDGSDVDLAATQTNYGAELYASALLSANPSVATSASTEMATGGYMKLCFSVALPSTVTDPDPGGPGTIQGKTITMDFTITGNQV